MEHDITHYAKTRHTAKAYNPDKKISDENVEKIKELLRFSASSTNAQPWHFVIASTDEGMGLEEEQVTVLRFFITLGTRITGIPTTH